MKITRPALKYYGGKWKIADWIISFFPDHINYVEPCGGAASVLLRKPLSPLETYNDIDGRIVNFFKVLRDHPEALVSKIKLTPWSRVEQRLAKELSEDPIEDARRFFVSCWQSFSGGKKSSWRASADYSRRPRSPGADMIEIEHLFAVADRLMNVQFECGDALSIIKKYDNPNALLYFDPPYTRSSRANKDFYTFEVDDNFHVTAAGLLNDCQGMVVVSGYACPEYQEFYEDREWIRFDKDVVCNAGAKRIESIWLSEKTMEALKKRICEKELELFPEFGE
jgi:DNA adenine methylase